MFKKIGRFVTMTLLAAAAGAGTYFYLKNREEEDYFEDSEDDVNDDLEEFLKSEAETAGEKTEKREYVPLNFSRESEEDGNPEKIAEAAAEAADEDSVSAREFVANVIGEAPKVSESPLPREEADKVSTFEFTSFDASKSET